MAIEQLYRRIRSIVRELGHRESLYVIWAYSQSLQIDHFNIPRDIEVHDAFRNANPRQAIISEWTLELLAREVIRYADEEPRRGRSMRSWGTLATIVNLVRELENEIYAEFGGERIHLELMRIAHRQFAWQQSRINWRPIVRYYKLFNTTQISNLIFQATGLTLDEIYLVGMCFLGSFLHNPRTIQVLDVQVPGLDQQHVDRFLAFTSLTRNELAARLRAEHRLDGGFAYRYSSLREFPMVRFAYHGRDEVACPVPTLLFWRITKGLYYTLREMGGFPTAFGASFQSYVGEVLRQRITDPQLNVIAEEQYRVGRFRKDTVDWIVNHGEESSWFVECKTKRLTWASKAGLADVTALDQDIRKLAGAVVQVYKTISDYRLGRYPNLPFVEGRCIYPAVVTLEDWYFFGFDLPDRLDRAVRIVMAEAGLPAAWLDDFPYVVLSVQEFEKVAGVINSEGIRRVIEGKVRSREYRRWGFASYCSDRYPEITRNLPDLFHDEYEAMFADLERAQARR